ncbi:DUF4435 domain-containing protein [Yersinia aleksiciae]|uniref:DUF4435 domain-containing protein n=1 Tax=Yersinia aleksiciae TaxID=263819 RepID=UPI001643C3BF|nr:DUF4435 domain-containing protein [Yersinia aleksiciae]
MSRVDILTAARATPSVKFLEFTRVYSSKGKEYCVSFFEGEDAKYYTVRINNILPPQQFTSINCGGKKNVIGIRKLIREHKDYADSFCMFFIDSDFDDNSELSNWQDTYVTPCYSVENFYLHPEAFKQFLTSEMNISPYGEESECHEKVCEIFNDFIQDIKNKLLDFNVWAYAYKCNESNGKLAELNLNNIDLDKLVELEGFSLKRNYGDCQEIFPNTYKLDENLISSAKTFFENDKEIMISKMRGKQLLECLRVFLEAIKRDRSLKKERVIFKNKGTVKITLTKSNMLSEYSQYAHTPTCLKQFLQQQPIIYGKAS